MIPSKEQVEEIIKRLQPILHIQDWEIEFDYMDKEKFQEEYEEDYQAHNTTNRLLNYSYIVINKDTTEDWYKSLVHELIHLIFDPIEVSEAITHKLTAGKVQETLDELTTTSKETVVDRVSRIFVQLYPVTNFIKEGEEDA